MTGCTRLVFADFEGTLFYRDGKTVTALQESGTWMALGSERIAPLENKAVATTGTMAIYELTPAMVSLFEGRKIGTTVETDLGTLVNAGMLFDNLGRSPSTCIVKVRGPVWTGYVFFGAGKTIGASYVSEKDRFYGETAIKAIKNATGKAVAAIYFLEGGIPFDETVAPATVVAPVVKPAEAVKPAEVPKSPEIIKPVAPQKPAEAMKPQIPSKPVEVVQSEKPTPVTSIKPLVATKPHQVELIVSTSDQANLKHQSRIATLEALETHNIVWVDATVLKSLRVKESDVVSLILPGGKTERVTIAHVDMTSGRPGVAILPKKFRKRLSLIPGSKITIRP